MDKNSNLLTPNSEKIRQALRDNSNSEISIKKLKETTMKESNDDEEIVLVEYACTVKVKKQKIKLKSNVKEVKPPSENEGLSKGFFSKILEDNKVIDSSIENKKMQADNSIVKSTPILAPVGLGENIVESLRSDCINKEKNKEIKLIKDSISTDKSITTPSIKDPFKNQKETNGISTNQSNLINPFLSTNMLNSGTIMPTSNHYPRPTFLEDKNTRSEAPPNITQNTENNPFRKTNNVENPFLQPNKNVLFSSTNQYTFSNNPFGVNTNPFINLSNMSNLSNNNSQFGMSKLNNTTPVNPLNQQKLQSNTNNDADENDASDEEGENPEQELHINQGESLIAESYFQKIDNSLEKNKIIDSRLVEKIIIFTSAKDKKILLNGKLSFEVVDKTKLIIFRNSIGSILFQGRVINLSNAKEVENPNGNSSIIIYGVLDSLENNKTKNIKLSVGNNKETADYVKIFTTFKSS